MPTLYLESVTNFYKVHTAGENPHAISINSVLSTSIYKNLFNHIFMKPIIKKQATGQTRMLTQNSHVAHVRKNLSILYTKIPPSIPSSLLGTSDLYLVITSTICLYSLCLVVQIFIYFYLVLNHG